MPGCKKGDQAVVIRAVRDPSKLGCFVKVLEVGTQYFMGQWCRSCKIRFSEPKVWGTWDPVLKTYTRKRFIKSTVGWFPDANLQPIRPPAIQQETAVKLIKSLEKQS